MKLDRNTNGDRKGKYALVRLRGIEDGSEAACLLQRLDELGYLDWGQVGMPDEFFVVKLRDRFAAGALNGYIHAVLVTALGLSTFASGEDRKRELFEWAREVESMLNRASDRSPYCKEPD